MSLEFASQSLPAIPRSAAGSGHQDFTVLRLRLPNFSQAVTLIFLHLALPLHHNELSELPLWSFPISGFVLSPAAFLKMMGLFESFGGTRYSSLCWTAHWHHKALHVSGCRLLNASRIPLIIVTTKECTQTSPVPPQVTVTCKSKACTS